MRPLRLAATILVAAVLPTAADDGPVGAWKSTASDITMTFSSDGTYVVAPTGQQQTTGKWTQVDDLITFLDEPGSPDACVGVEGTWSMTHESGMLAFIEVDDNCAPREQYLTLPWSPAGG